MGFNEAAASNAAEMNASFVKPTVCPIASMRPRQVMPRRSRALGGYCLYRASFNEAAASNAAEIP